MQDAFNLRFQDEDEDINEDDYTIMSSSECSSPDWLWICLVLFAGLKHLDPNREASKKALEQKKEISKRLGRPLIHTNPYEVF
jgi:hypothetical protein